jgi:murein DD-endopeptidase MepM/ murein hydrolase activator NlpD
VAPVAVTSLFGRRLHPITGTLQAHQGLDLAASEGQLVATAGRGTVVRAGWCGGYGLQVEVVHAGGVHTRYGHLSRILVEPGDALEPGDVVGLAGTTGLSTGPHLHFELWRAGRALDPLRVLGPAGALDAALTGAQTREGRRPSGRRPR